MSGTEALINLGVAILVMTPFMLLAWWVIRRTPLAGLKGVHKWRAYRIRIGATAMFILGFGLMLWFLLNVITAVLDGSPADVPRL